MWNTPVLRTPLLLMALVGCLAYEFTVVLPVMAEQTFHGDARTYGFMTAAMGIGAVVGGLFVAARGRTGTRTVITSAGVFGVAILAAALAPVLWMELIALALVGAASIGFMTRGNSTLQLEAAPTMRGRVMALWSVAFLGSTPIGGPIAGVVTEQLGGRAGLLLGAIACFVAVGLGALMLRRTPATHVAAEQPIAEQPPGEHSPGEQPPGEHPNGEQPIDERKIDELPIARRRRDEWSQRRNHVGSHQRAS